MHFLAAQAQQFDEFKERPARVALAVRPDLGVVEPGRGAHPGADAGQDALAVVVECFQHRLGVAGGAEHPRVPVAGPVVDPCAAFPRAVQPSALAVEHDGLDALFDQVLDAQAQVAVHPSEAARDFVEDFLPLPLFQPSVDLLVARPIIVQFADVVAVRTGVPPPPRERPRSGASAGRPSPRRARGAHGAPSWCPRPSGRGTSSQCRASLP